MHITKLLSVFLMILIIGILLSACTTNKNYQNFSSNNNLNSQALENESKTEEDIPMDVDYVFAKINGTVKKMMVGDSFDGFRIVSAQSTYLPNRSPYGEKDIPSQYFEKNNYFLWNATLEIEGTFYVSGLLSQDSSEQYSNMWVLQPDGDSICKLPQIVECEVNNEIYLPNYSDTSKSKNDVILTKICMYYGQNDAVNTGE